MVFTKEQLDKANKAKTVEEVMSIAKAEGMYITKEQAQAFLSRNEEKELSDNELENVAGGTCYSSGVWGPNGFKKYAIVTAGNQCSFQSHYQPCGICGMSFTCGATLYCSIRTEDNDPYR